MSLLPSTAFSVSVTTFLMPVLKCEISITLSKLLFSFLRITELHLQKNLSIWEAQKRAKKTNILIHLNFSFQIRGFWIWTFIFGENFGKEKTLSCLEEFMILPALITVRDQVFISIFICLFPELLAYSIDHL